MPGVPTFAPTHLHREQICTERLQFLVPSDERLAIQRRREMKYSLLFGRQLLPPQDSWIRVIIDLIFLLISSSRRYHLHSQGQGTARGQPSGCGTCWHLRAGTWAQPRLCLHPTLDRQSQARQSLPVSASGTLGGDRLSRCHCPPPLTHKEAPRENRGLRSIPFGSSFMNLVQEAGGSSFLCKSFSQQSETFPFDNRQPARGGSCGWARLEAQFKM